MFERAAVMALFQAGAHPAYRELERAVRSLERGGSALASTMPTRAAALRMMAMVAAGFQPSAQLWWSTVHSTARCVGSQHLRLLLAVLCSPSATEPDGSQATGGVSVGLDSSLMLQHVLLESMDASQPDEHSGNEEYRRLLLSDGLAMACRFLPDQQLQSFLVRLHDVRRTRKHSPPMLPRLAGASLTRVAFARAADASCGLVGRALPHWLERARAAALAGNAHLAGPRRIAPASCHSFEPRFQAYVDRTADVQTAALLVACSPPSLISLPQAKHWLSLYRALLNRREGGRACRGTDREWR